MRESKGDRLPIVDEADVDRLAETFLKDQNFMNESEVDRAALGYDFALKHAKSIGASPAWSEAFAEQVRRRAIWGRRQQ